MKILNIKEMRQISAGAYTATIDLDTASSPVGPAQSAAVMNVLGPSLLSPNPFNATAYFDALKTAGVAASADIHSIQLTNIH